MNRKILVFGFLLAVIGFFLADLALVDGPRSWALSQKFFWGTPIANFVFWIGLAHAGTFFSAILLVFEINWRRRVAFIAELSTLSALCVAGCFLLIHLGRPELFYAMIPMGNLRSFYGNIESPLVWDFMAILSYALLSTLYLLLHIFSVRYPALEKYRKPFAWILFPLVLWVHTIVSMDFAVTFVPEWGGGYFPLYFVCGALYSGVALVLLLISMFGKRVRRVEEVLLAFSWAMLAFWIWEAVTKGVWHPEVLVFGFLIPQFLWMPAVREKVLCRVLLACSVLLGLWGERLVLVQPEPLEWTAVDWGFFPLGIGLFCVAFSLAKMGEERILRRFGAMDDAEAEERPSVPFPRVRFASSVALGCAGALLFLVYFMYNAPEFSPVRSVPVLFPVAAIFAGLLLALWGVRDAWGSLRAVSVAAVSGLLAVSVLLLVYRGPETSFSEARAVVKNESELAETENVPALWKARCAACHGEDGNLNRKFVHEFYPLPQTLSLFRMDSLGEDSLVHVVLEGRSYMQPFAGRISKENARLLVRHLRALAEKKEGETR